MKKISTAAALLAAGALLFGSLIVACSPHGTGIIDDPTPTPKPTPASEEEDNGKPVDGSWDFTGTDTYSIGHSAYASLTDKALTNPTAKGATLSLSGSVKWGNGSASDTSNFCLWFDKGSEYEAGKEDSKSKGHFTLTIDNMSTLTIVATGNGSSDTAKRWIAACNKDKKVLTNGTLTALSSGDADKKLSIKLPKAGTYYIYTSGTRIRSLQITNQAFESKTKEITNDAETLGLVATGVRNSDETIATGEVKNGKVVITSKKEGTTKVYAGTSETEYATINVTVSSTGAITTNIIKYVAFTAATNDTTANDVATLGLVGATVTSSAEEYVKADLTTTTGKITIKSVKAPGDSAKNVTITVTDAAGKTATIPVTEARDGSLTLGNITKYAVPKPVSGTDFEVSADKKLTAKKDNMEYKLSTAATYTDLTKDTPTEALAEGSYLIRFKAVTNTYAESEATSFTISNGGSVEYVLTPTDISSWIEAKTALTDITTSGANFKAGAGVTYDTSKLSSGSIKLGGYAQKDGKNSIQFTTTSANATVTVKFFGDGDSSVGRFVGMKSGNNKPFDSAGTANTESITDTNNSITAGGASNIVTATLIAPTAGLYTIGGSGAIYITELKISQTN